MTRWAFAGVILAVIIGFVAGCFELAWRVCCGEDIGQLGPRA